MEHIEGLFVDIRYAQKVGYLRELETKVLEDFTIKEKAPTRTFSLLKVSTSTFTLRSQLRTTLAMFKSPFSNLIFIDSKL